MGDIGVTMTCVAAGDQAAGGSVRVSVWKAVRVAAVVAGEGDG